MDKKEYMETMIAISLLMGKKPNHETYKLLRETAATWRVCLSAEAAGYGECAEEVAAVCAAIERLENVIFASRWEKQGVTDDPVMEEAAIRHITQ